MCEEKTPKGSWEAGGKGAWAGSECGVFWIFHNGLHSSYSLTLDTRVVKGLHEERFVWPFANSGTNRHGAIVTQTTTGSFLPQEPEEVPTPWLSNLGRIHLPVLSQALMCILRAHELERQLKYFHGQSSQLWK